MSNITITNHEPQDITITQQDNQLIFVNGGGEVIGITDVKVNGNSVVTNNIAYVIVPTKVSQLQNDSHFITTETDPTVPSVVKSITLADINSWNNKQDELVSGSTIKTINNTSLLGSGNIDVGGVNYTAGTGIDITEDVISNTITSYDDLNDLPTIPSKVSELLNDSDFVSSNELAEVAFTGGYGSLSNTPEYTSDFINDGNGTYPFLLNKSSSYIDGIGTLGGATAQSRNLAYTWDNGTIQESHTVANYDDLTSELSTKQDTLVSGTNIKTINNESILGSGNITVGGGGSTTDVQINGTSITSGGVANIVTESAYNSSTNKIATKNDIPTTTSQLTNDSNYAVTNSDNNFSSQQTFNEKVNFKGNGVELYNATPYIDFHFNNSTSDYTSRIIETSSGILNSIGKFLAPNIAENSPLIDLNQSVSSSTNLNDFTTSGNQLFSNINGAINAPTSTLDGFLIVLNLKPVNNMIMQLFYNHANDTLYFRFCWYGASWTSWKIL